MWEVEDHENLPEQVILFGSFVAAWFVDKRNKKYSLEELTECVFTTRRGILVVT